MCQPHCFHCNLAEPCHKKPPVGSLLNIFFQQSCWPSSVTSFDAPLLHLPVPKQNSAMIRNNNFFRWLLYKPTTLTGFPRAWAETKLAAIATAVVRWYSCNNCLALSCTSRGAMNVGPCASDSSMRTFLSRPALSCLISCKVCELKAVTSNGKSKIFSA